MVDLGTGNNNKINWALADKQEMIDIIEMVSDRMTTAEDEIYKYLFLN